MSVFDAGERWDLPVTLVTTLDSVGAVCASTLGLDAAEPVLVLSLDAAKLPALGPTFCAGMSRNRIVAKKSVRKSWTKCIRILASEQP